MEDLTKYILISPTWLIFGLLIYSFISLIKVYLILYIQPKIFNNPYNENVYEFFTFKFIGNLFKNSELIKSTLKYIFKYKEKDFQILENTKTKSLRVTYNILDGLTNFLKPYFFFAIIWAFFGIWISNKFYINESKMILGEIQKSLFFIENVPIIKYFQEYKSVIFLVYAIICIFIPILYYNEEMTKSLKKYLNLILLYLSLGANISFFGIQTGNMLSDKSKELSDLQLNITSIHDRIFKRLAVLLEYVDFKDILQTENEKYVKALNQFQLKTNSDDLPYMMDVINAMDEMDNLKNLKLH